jgi:hypothetical protein
LILWVRGEAPGRPCVRTLQSNWCLVYSVFIPIPRVASRIVLVAAAFVTLAAAIMTQPPKGLRDYDQSFYLTIAYDVERYGVYSNGIFDKNRYSIFSDGILDKTDNVSEAPRPGMFFVPGYPLLVFAAMKLDARFARAVECSVEVDFQKRNAAECEAYTTPMHIIHAFLLAFAVLAIAVSGERICDSTRVFWLSGILATGSLSAEAIVFSFVMTESLTVSLYSIFVMFAVLAWKTARAQYFALAGLFLGLLCLTRLSFIILVPISLAFIVVNRRTKSTLSVWNHFLVFAVGCLIVIGPWAARNYFSVGKWGLTEEYGSGALIERFAYNDMTTREFVLAFPYCMPGIGDIAFDQIRDNDSIRRFVYGNQDSFFQVGRGHRNRLVNEYGHLDPLIAGIARDEIRTNWWRHLLVSIPVGWCEMWVGWLWSLVLIPLSGWAGMRAVQQRRPLFLLYAAPALIMLGVHASVAPPDTRYGLILIGPFSVGAAWIISTSLWNGRLRLRTLAPGRRRLPPDL